MDAYHKKPKQYQVAREGWLFILISLFVLVVCINYQIMPAIYFFIALTLFIIFFFRNPMRQSTADDVTITSPADGRVIIVDHDAVAPLSAEPAIKISIFMSVFNVHINRSPIQGMIKKIVYYPGQFLVASLDKASEKNERNAMQIIDSKGRYIEMVQIAGLVARRIVCYLKKSQNVLRGERFGLIRFGSRVDLYLPKETNIFVSVGDRVKSGESMIGRLV